MKNNNTNRLLILIEPELKEKIKIAALKDRRTVSAFISSVMEKKITERDRVNYCGCFGYKRNSNPQPHLPFPTKEVKKNYVVGEDGSLRCTLCKAELEDPGSESEGYQNLKHCPTEGCEGQEDCIDVTDYVEQNESDIAV